MSSVVISHPVEGINTIAFEIKNDTPETKQYYIQDINIQSFMRNIDWTTNCFTWIEARENQIMLPMYFDMETSSDEGAISDIVTTVYVLCCLRIEPGTYANTEEVVEQINTCLQSTIAMPQKSEQNQPISLRDVPCALYSIDPHYNSAVTSYKIDGFTVGLVADTSTYITTAEGNEATTKIAPAVLTPEFFNLYGNASNSIPNASIITPRPRPIVHYDGKGNYTLDYANYTTNNAIYNADVRAMKDITSSLNNHAIDFNTSITNQLGLTPYKLPIEHLFINKDNEPIICYDNGKNYREYLIDPRVADIATISSYFINTVGSTATVSNREQTNDTCGFKTPLVMANAGSHLMKAYTKKLPTTLTYENEYAVPFSDRIIINNDLSPVYFIINDLRLTGNVVTDESGNGNEYRDMILNIINTLIIGQRLHVKRDTSAPNLSYKLTASSSSMDVILTLWFDGQVNPCMLKDMHASLNIRQNGVETDQTALLFGMRVSAYYAEDSNIASIIINDPDEQFGVTYRLDPNEYVCALVVENDAGAMRKELSDTEKYMNERTATVNDKPAGKCMANTILETTIAGGQFMLTTPVESTDLTNTINEESTVDFHYRFSRAVCFQSANPIKLNTIPDLTIEETSHTSGSGKTVGSFSHKYNEFHTHSYLALLKSVTMKALDQACIRSDDDVILAIFDPSIEDGCRYYARFVLEINQNNAFKPDDIKYELLATFSDKCDYAHSGSATRYVNLVSGSKNDLITSMQSTCHYAKNGVGCSYGAGTDLVVDCDGQSYVSIDKGVLWNEIKSLYNTFTARTKKSRVDNGGFIFFVEGTYKNGSFTPTTVDGKYQIVSTEYELLKTKLQRFIKDTKFNDNVYTNIIKHFDNHFSPCNPIGHVGFDPINDDISTKSHDNTWFAQNHTWVLNNNKSSAGYSCYEHYMDGRFIFITEDPDQYTYGFSDVPIAELDKYGMSLKLESLTGSGNNYKITLKPCAPTEDGVHTMPTNGIFTTACACGQSYLHIKTKQYLAYSSVTNYQPTENELSPIIIGPIERGLDDIQEGANIINGEVYLMDRNNVAAMTVNPVKYYPFFPFSNKIFVYMTSSSDIDATIESQPSNVRSIRTTLAELHISSVFQTRVNATGGEPGDTFELSGTGAIRSTDTHGQNNMISLTLGDGTLRFDPVATPSPITINTAPPISVNVTETPLDGTLEINALTLTGLNGKMHMNDTTIDLGTGKIDASAYTTRDYGFISNEYISESFISSIITDDISVNIDNALFTSANIDAFTFQINDTANIYEVLDLLTDVVTTSTNAYGDIITETTRELISDWTTSANDIVGFGKIKLQKENPTVSIDGAGIEGITASVTLPTYQNQEQTYIMTHAIPVEVNMNGVSGRFSSRVEIEYTERLYYQVEISPYTITIQRTIKVPPNASRYIYITGNVHRYPIWESTHSIIYKEV
jgi:hypothetical protein